MACHRATRIIMVSRYSGESSQLTGESIQPRLSRKAFKSPLWSPEKIVFHTTWIISDPTMEGIYRHSVKIVLGTA